MSIKKISFVLLLSFCLFIPSAFAGKIKESSQNIPTNIKASRMEYDAVKQTVVFYKKVHVIRTDFNLWSDKLTVYLEKSDAISKTESDEDEDGLAGMGAGDISIIVAEGNVIMKSKDKESHSKKATYTVKTDTLKLEGPPNPWLKDKDNTISGQTIYHFMQADKSEVRGGVSASFTTLDQSPEKKDDDEN